MTSISVRTDSIQFIPKVPVHLVNRLERKDSVNVELQSVLEGTLHGYVTEITCATYNVFCMGLPPILAQ